MSNIVRWNPMREMATMRTFMDRFFDEWRPFNLFDENWREGWHRLAVDVTENDGAYTVTTELPGVKAENIQVRHENGMLLIDAEIPETTTETKGENERALIKERRYGRYSRSIQLPDVDLDKVEATYDNGVLTLTLPKSPAAQPHPITVKVGNHHS
jgi:HSP20 family protein